MVDVEESFHFMPFHLVFISRTHKKNKNKELEKQKVQNELLDKE